MGVDRDFYVILGYEIPMDVYNKWKSDTEWDAYEGYINGFYDYRIIEDGMSGEYAYFGKVMYSATHHSNNYHETIPQIDNLEKMELRYKFFDEFDLNMNMSNEGSFGLPELIAFEHYC